MEFFSERSEIILKVDGFPGENYNLSPPINGTRSSLTLYMDILWWCIVIIIDINPLTEKLRHVFQTWIWRTTQ